MRDYVAVKSVIDVLAFPTLKREALMFNRIVIPYLPILFDAAARSPEAFYCASEIDWLADQGVIITSEPIPLNPKPPASSQFKRFLQAKSKYIKKMEKIAKKKRNRNRLVRNLEAREGEEFAEFGITAIDFEVRCTAIVLREVYGIDAYPVLSYPVERLQEYEAKKSDIVQIVLNALPVPSGSTSWEQIIEYRNDSLVQGKFLALRNWMNDIARSKLTPIEIEEKLEWLIYDYQRHLNLHKLKTNTSTLETVIIAGAELVENLVKFNFSKAAKALFSLKHRKISLMEGEMNSPGSEVAYIFDTRKYFQGSVITGHDTSNNSFNRSAG